LDDLMIRFRGALGQEREWTGSESGLVDGEGEVDRMRR